MDVVFLVTGFLTKESVEKVVLYNGRSAKKAFDYMYNYGKEAKISVEIFEDGNRVKVITE